MKTADCALPTCSKTFTLTRSWQVYCSQRCRKTFHEQEATREKNRLKDHIRRLEEANAHLTKQLNESPK